MKNVLFLSFGLTFLLTGCIADEPPPPPTAEGQIANPPPTTVFDSQFKTLDKAKHVQDTLNQDKQNTDKQIQDQGG